MEENMQAAGWLILHTEGIEEQTFALKNGRNYIGRPAPGHNPDIALQNDNYISRYHAVIIVSVNDKNKFVYTISDSTEVQGKPSLNGTYINGDENRIDEKPHILKDEDTIQIGLTKLVLKTTEITVNIDDAIKLVQKMNYQKTVDVEKSASLRKIIKKN